MRPGPLNRPFRWSSPAPGVAGGDGAAQPTAFTHAPAGLAAAAGIAVSPSVVAATAVVKGYNTGTSVIEPMASGPGGVTEPMASTAGGVTRPMESASGGVK